MPRSRSRPSARTRARSRVASSRRRHVLALDHVGVLALGAGREDAGKRAQRRADHGADLLAAVLAGSCATVSIGALTGDRSAAGGSG